MDKAFPAHCLVGKGTVDWLQHSRLSDTIRKQSYAINRRQIELSRDAILNVDPAARALARMARVPAKCRRPERRSTAPCLDIRVARTRKPPNAGHANLLMPRLPNQCCFVISFLGFDQVAAPKRIDQQIGGIARRWASGGEALCFAKSAMTAHRDQVRLALARRRGARRLPRTTFFAIGEYLARRQSRRRSSISTDFCGRWGRLEPTADSKPSHKHAPALPKSNKSQISR
jgi:hypothetical protein